MTGLNLLDIPVGARVRLADGRRAAVVDNPQDGTWLICRFLEPSGAIPADADDEMVFATDIADVEGA